MRHKNKSAGFTIIEMMTVVTIVGLLLVVTLPAMNDFIVNARIRSAASDILAGVLFARSQAVAQNTNIYLVASASGWSGGWTVSTSTTGTPVLRSQDPITGIAVTGPATTTITYQRTGRITSTANLKFSLGQSGGSTTNIYMRCVYVDVAGRPYVVVDSNKTGSC